MALIPTSLCPQESTTPEAEIAATAPSASAAQMLGMPTGGNAYKKHQKERRCCARAKKKNSIIIKCGEHVQSLPMDGNTPE